MKKDCVNSSDNCYEWSLPDFLENYPCKEISKTTKLCIPYSKPDIKKICKALIKISISKFEVICTPMGKKLILEGTQYLKIVYKSKSSCENIHSECFSMPFCTFMLLNKDYCNVTDIKSKVEYASITPIDSKCFYLSTVLFFCPVFKKGQNTCSCNLNDDSYYWENSLNTNENDKYTDSYSCNINSCENNIFSE